MPQSPRKKHNDAQRQSPADKEKAKRQHQDRERGQGAKEIVGQKKSRRDEREEENLWRLYF